ncbi:hypothetical protein evm_002309 [Chilo suppressalis]|nr:hypothetical protein evm_002309 [Chilo suppressalis]
MTRGSILWIPGSESRLPCLQSGPGDEPNNVPTAGAQAFPMDGIGRLGHDPPCGPSADWWVLTTADATGTNGLTCLPKHGGARDRTFLVTHPMTDHCESCLTSTIAAERANQLRHRAPLLPTFILIDLEV